MPRQLPVAASSCCRHAAARCAACACRGEVSWSHAPLNPPPFYAFQRDPSVLRAPDARRHQLLAQSVLLRPGEPAAPIMAAHRVKQSLETPRRQLGST